MRIDILTLFPEMFDSILKTSILGRALDKNLLQVKLHNIRDFAKNKHKQTDDYSYGGGQGMVMTPQPLFDCLNFVLNECSQELPNIIYFSPHGKVFTQEMAGEFSCHEHLILLCGHYEGIDQRVIDRFVSHEISIGDYVLTGGEIPAMAFMDCISRLIPGVLGNPESNKDESFSRGLLEYPQYTRPQIYDGYEVPEVLLSGNHKDIERWRLIESLKATFRKRPDLLNLTLLSPEERAYLDSLKQ